MKLLLTTFLTWLTILLSASLFAQTASDPINLNGQSNIVIENLHFNSGSNGAAIKLTNCTNVLIQNCTFSGIPTNIGIQTNGCANIEVTRCEFEQFRSGIYCINSTQLNIHCNSFRDIAGSYPRGQIVQFNNCNGSGMRVNHNTCDHTFGTGDPEDLINMYASGGTSADPLQIIGNKLRGGGPSKSGGGIMVGDDDGHDIIVADNILVDPGQYGIGCPAGYNITIRNNQIYGRQQSFTNVGLYVGLQGEINAGHPCVANTITVENNRVNWKNKNGQNNGFYNCSCCAGINKSGNDFSANINASILPEQLTLSETSCGANQIDPAPSCETGLPNGYDLILCQNFETDEKAADYLGNDVWYFYDGGNASNNNDPDLDDRFIIETNPLETGKALKLIKFDEDQDYSNQNLNPRTELSYRPSMERSTDKEIYVRLKTFFPTNQQQVFSAEFIQFWLHGNSNIPLQIEVRNGQFGARKPRSPGDYKTPFSGKYLDDYLNQWITWEIQAKFNNENGYWQIFMNDELVFSHTETISDWPSDNGTWHPQYGAYANNGGAGDMIIYFDDFLIAEKSDDVIDPEPNGLSPIDDAYLQGGTNYNTNDLRVENNNRSSYLKYDLSTMRNNISSAQLQLTVGSDAGQGTIRVFAADGNDWTESTLSVVNAPTLSNEVDSKTGTFNSGDVVTFDLSPYIYESGIYSLRIEMDEGGNDVTFNSSETSSGPVLMIQEETITSISDLSFKNFYPNPVNESLFISANFREVKIYDLSGRLKMSSRLNHVNCTSLAPGLYVLELVKEGEIRRSMFTKK